MGMITFTELSKLDTRAKATEMMKLASMAHVKQNEQILELHIRLVEAYKNFTEANSLMGELIKQASLNEDPNVRFGERQSDALRAKLMNDKLINELCDRLLALILEKNKLVLQ